MLASDCLPALSSGKSSFTKTQGFARVRPIREMTRTMESVLERLQILEGKVRETLAELVQSRSAREALEAKVRALQVELGSREQEAAALQADRSRLEAEVSRLLSERKEVQTRVEGLLGEIANLEAAVQGGGG